MALSAFLLATDPDKGHARPALSRSTLHVYRAGVNAVALENDPTNPFNYAAYDRLGYAASPTCIWTLPLRSVLEIPKTCSSIKNAVEDIRWALKCRDEKYIYIEIPGGFRCGPSLKYLDLGKEDFLVMAVKLPVVKLYSIVFQDLNRRLITDLEHHFAHELAWSVKYAY